MIICFNNKINTFSKNFIKKTSLTQKKLQALMPSCDDITCNCPKCKAKANFSYHGSYIRNISCICDNQTFNFKISVTRVICNSCKSTHALLPDFIVPYKIYSRQTILSIISKALSTSILETADELNISFQLIYALIALIISFYDYADSLHREKSVCKNFSKKYFIKNCLKFCNSDFNIRFYKRYIWVFLMSKFRNEKSPPITIAINLCYPHNF